MALRLIFHPTAFRHKKLQMTREIKSSPVAIAKSFWSNRQLIWQMTKRDVVGRYRGSIMGIAWSFFNPILMLTVYTFVFSVVFKARWDVGGEESKTEFAIILFAGMIVHALFAECVNRAPSLILSNVNYVKKVVFPLEILPWVTMGSALFHTAISIIVLLTFFASLNFYLNWTIVFLPLVLLPLVLVTMGAAWFLASTGVYLRDVGQTTGLVTTIMLFLAPVFYPISVLPQEYQQWLHLNPLTFIIEQMRNVLIWGKIPDFYGFGWYSAASLLVAWMGYFWFQKTRKGFADVL
jgi:lipopolysaccharide transport system permease protein|uniref:ABC transporter permease n=1 Tax=Methylocaldum sp. GT1BB TaxID=3438963 RepID=UPI003FA38D25